MSNIKDVAKLAGVSTATVSRVLANNYPVANKTKNRVLEAVQSLNYEPNRMARNLRKRETKTVIVLLPDLKNPFFSEVIRGMEDVAAREGYHLFLGNTNNDVEREREYIKMLNEQMADGLILTTARIGKDDILQLSEKKPLVLACEYLEGTDIPCVSIDNIGSARRATNHLISLGHKRIAHLSGPINVVLCRDRMNGYLQALHSKGIPVDESLMEAGDFSIDSGYLLTRKLLSLERRPTAIFAANDEMAIGAIKAVKEAKLSVPEDVAIVGFDNIPISTIIEPALTTISQPKYIIGKTAMEMVLNLIKKVPIPRHQMVLPEELIIRESCGVHAAL
jgi:LacI family repressor for deo operon, udp, cdd, tsx, nupC, and nupG